MQQNEVLGKIGVTDDEARKYYDAHLSEFTTPPTVTLREILVAVPSDAKGINVAADEAAKAKAEDIRARVTTGGENFEKLARRSLGLAVEGQRRPDRSAERQRSLARSAQADRGDEAGRRQRGRCATPRGYQILKLESITPTQTMPFEQAREQISERVFTDKRKAEFQKYLREAPRAGDHRVEERRT